MIQFSNPDFKNGIFWPLHSDFFSNPFPDEVVVKRDFFT